MSGPCCLHRVCKVDPSIWVVRFFNSSQLLAGPGCPGAVVVVVLDAPPPFVPLLHPLPLESPFELGHPELAGVCCFEAASVRDWPHKSWPMAVRLVALELVGSWEFPQGSFEAVELVSFVVAVLKLQVEEVRPRLFSTVVTAAGATEPGVSVGSSLGSFRAVPFHALPGTNSGMPKLSSSLVLVLVGFSPELGQPASLPCAFDQGPLFSRSKLGDDCELGALLVPGAPGALGNSSPNLSPIIFSTLEPPTALLPVCSPMLMFPRPGNKSSGPPWPACC